MVRWCDGVSNPERTSLNVRTMSLEAIPSRRSDVDERSESPIEQDRAQRVRGDSAQLGSQVWQSPSIPQVLTSTMSSVTVTSQL
jgi:hypothetical protein